MKPCPYCGEQIQLAAVKCRYCGEWLDPSRRPANPGAGDQHYGDTSGARPWPSGPTHTSGMWQLPTAPRSPTPRPAPVTSSAHDPVELGLSPFDDAAASFEQQSQVEFGGPQSSGSGRGSADTTAPLDRFQSRRSADQAPPSWLHQAWTDDADSEVAATAPAFSPSPAASVDPEIAPPPAFAPRDPQSPEVTPPPTTIDSVIPGLATRPSSDAQPLAGTGRELAPRRSITEPIFQAKTLPAGGEAEAIAARLIRSTGRRRDPALAQTRVMASGSWQDRSQAGPLPSPTNLPAVHAADTPSAAPTADATPATLGDTATPAALLPAGGQTPGRSFAPTTPSSVNHPEAGKGTRASVDSPAAPTATSASGAVPGAAPGAAPSSGPTPGTLEEFVAAPRAPRGRSMSGHFVTKSASGTNSGSAHSTDAVLSSTRSVSPTSPNGRSESLSVPPASVSDTSSAAFSGEYKRGSGLRTTLLAGAALMVVGIATTAWVKRDQLFPELINVDEGIAAVEPPSLDGQASAAATRSAKSATTDRLTANQEAIANAALAQAQEIAETATTELSGTTNPAAPSDSDNLGVAANAAGAALQNSEAQSAVESLELTKAEDGAQAEADNAGGLPTPPSGDAEQEAEHVSSKGSLQDHLRRARAHLRNKLPEKAWLEVEEALSLGLDDPTTLETAAKVQYERREFPAARRYAEKCLLHDSKRMGCWLALADISERLDDLSTAADAWRTVLELDPRGRHAKRARKEAERLEATLADGSATRN